MATILDFLAKRSLGQSKSVTQWKSDMFISEKHYYHTDFRAHYGCVNAIEFSNNDSLLASGGDDKKVLVWSVDKALASKHTPTVPHKMNSEHHSNIFSLAFNASNQLVLSGGNDGCIIIHDVTTAHHKETYLCEEAIYCISCDPTNESVFVAASHEGEAFIYDIRSDDDPVSFPSGGLVKGPMHSVQYNPIYPQYLATVNSRETAKLWDIRELSRPVLEYKSSTHKYNGMCVSFNKYGDRLLVIGRWSPPLVYHVDNPCSIHEFNSDGYFNSCTIKSCCWAGPKSEYIVTGSDDFNVHMWEVPTSPTLDNRTIQSASKVLSGHRSLVNQVRYNDSYSLLATSGVEKIIKVWSPFDVTHGSNDVSVTDRFVYPHEDYVNLMLGTGYFRSHDVDPNLEEDTAIIAFFDSLVQRQLEEPKSSDTSEEEAANPLHNYEISSSSSSSSTSSFDDDDDDGDHGAPRRSLLSSSGDSRRRFQTPFERAMSRSGQSPPTGDRMQMTMNELIVRRKKLNLKCSLEKSQRNLKRRQRRSEMKALSSDSSDSDKDESRRSKARKRFRKRRKKKMERILTRIGTDSVASRLDDDRERAPEVAQQFAQLLQEQQANSSASATLRTLRTCRDSDQETELFGSKSNNHSCLPCAYSHSERLNAVNVGASTSNSNIQITDNGTDPLISSHTNSELTGGTQPAPPTDNQSDTKTESKFKSRSIRKSKQNRNFRRKQSDSDG